MEKVAPENYDKNDKIPKACTSKWGNNQLHHTRDKLCVHTHHGPHKNQLKELDEERERSSDRKPQINVTQQKVTTKYTQHLSKSMRKQKLGIQHIENKEQNLEFFTDKSKHRKITIFLSLSRKSVYTNAYKIDLKSSNYPGVKVKSTLSWDQKVLHFSKKWHPKIMTRMTNFDFLYKLKG